MTAKKKLLIIDDEKNLLRLLERIFSLEGYEVNTFENAAEGLKSIEHNTYFTALIDVILPDIKGTELTKMIRERSPGTEVIVMTAYANI